MSATDRVTLDPVICHGKSCICGLRYPAENLLELLAAGMRIEGILANYEDLERKDILAALFYAARLAHVKRMERWPQETPGRCAIAAQALRLATGSRIRRNAHAGPAGG